MPLGIHPVDRLAAQRNGRLLDIAMEQRRQRKRQRKIDGKQQELRTDPLRRKHAHQPMRGFDHAGVGQAAPDPSLIDGIRAPAMCQ